MKKNCGNCEDPQGPFKRFTDIAPDSVNLCIDVAACMKRRKKLEKIRYGDEKEIE